ncbi:hypothetical protein FPRO04_08814 [Fusarium proliferatum]|nr:hypothetical protein FPRO04_08814 [Fusarium proliferatum]
MATNDPNNQQHEIDCLIRHRVNRQRKERRGDGAASDRVARRSSAKRNPSHPAQDLDTPSGRKTLPSSNPEFSDQARDEPKTSKLEKSLSVWPDTRSLLGLEKQAIGRADRMPQTKDRDRYDGHGVPQMKSPELLDLASRDSTASTAVATEIARQFQLDRLLSDVDPVCSIPLDEILSRYEVGADFRLYDDEFVQPLRLHQLYECHGMVGDVCHQMHQLMAQRLNLRRKIDRFDLQMEPARLAEIMYPHIIPAEALGDAEEEMRANGLQNLAIPYRAPSQEALYTIPLNRKTKDEFTAQAIAHIDSFFALITETPDYPNPLFAEMKNLDDITPSPLPKRYPMVLKTENSDGVQIISQPKTSQQQRHNRRRPATTSSSPTQEGPHQQRYSLHETKATLYSLQDAEDFHVLSNCIIKSKASKQC